jgi:hypothetical protein
MIQYTDATTALKKCNKLIKRHEILKNQTNPHAGFSAPAVLHYKHITEHQDKCDFETYPQRFHMHTRTHANQTDGYTYANPLKKIICIINLHFTTVLWFCKIINTV